MTEQNFIEDKLIILTKQTLDIFLQQDNPAELIGLYTFYYYTAKWQNTNQIRCTTSYAANGLHMGEQKIRTLKKQLVDLGLIEDIAVRGNTNKIEGHYIRVNYVFKQETVEKYATLAKNHSVENENHGQSHTCNFPQCGKSHSVENCETNALSDNNINALSDYKSNALSADIDIMPNSSENTQEETEKIKTAEIKSEFETLWSMYPRKVGKKKAEASYTRARKHGTTFEQVKQGIENYKKQIEVKGTAPEYIKHGSTWFGNECWNDEYNFAQIADPKKSRNTGYDYTDQWAKDKEILPY